MKISKNTFTLLHSLQKFTLLSLTILLFVTAIFSQESIFEKGKKLYEQKKYDEAITVFMQGTRFKETKKDARIWHYLGLSYLNKRNYANSVGALRKATKYDKKNPEIWNDLGLGYKQISAIKKARKAFQKAIKYNPKVAAYRANLAYIYVKTGRYNKSQAQASKAIKLDPKNVNAYYFRGISYFWEGNFNKALRDANKAIELNPVFLNSYILKSDSLLYKYGKDWYENKRSPAKLFLMKEALDTLEKCLKTCESKYWDVVKRKLVGLNAFYKYFNKSTNKNQQIPVKNLNKTPIKILSKPRPGYTDVARQSNTQGEILVAVLFGSSGEIEETLVLKGLPHGLTEKAVLATKQIKFIPPTKNGKPISVVKMVVFNFSIY